MNKIVDAANKILDVQTIKIDSVIEQFGNVVTINGLSFANYKGDRIPVYRFAEGAGLAFWGGNKKLRELAQALEESYDGNLPAINEDFKRVGIKVRLGALVKTANGNPFRPVAKIGLVMFDSESATDAETGEVQDNFDLF